MTSLATNPLTRDDKRLIEANAELPGAECPAEGCDCTVEAVDVTPDGALYVAHESDRLGVNSRSRRGETDGCRVSAENDPTLGN